LKLGKGSISQSEHWSKAYRIGIYGEDTLHYSKRKSMKTFILLFDYNSPILKKA